MAMTSIGDLAAGFALRRQMVATKSELANLTQTMTTGQVADIGRHLNGNLAHLAAIDASMSRLDAYEQVTDRVSLIADACQTVLEQVVETAADLSPTLIAAGGAAAAGQKDAAARMAARSLETMVSALNTRLGDQSVMAGDAPYQPALISADTIMTAAATLTTGLTDATDVETALKSWFDDPAGFDALAYQGGAEQEPVIIADGNSVNPSVTALAPAIKDTLRAMIMAALPARGIPASDAEQSNLVKRGGEILVETVPARTELAANLGATIAEIEDTATRNTSHKTTLGLARNKLTLADPYDTATALTDAQSRLELIYTLTARLGRLSFAEYM